MNQKTKEFREKISQMFIHALEEKDGIWKKNWSGSRGGPPVNAITGKKYQGINRFYLKLTGAAMGSDDPRWVTFKQAQDKGWTVNKGAKGAKVEFWFPYDFTAKKLLAWEDYYLLKDNGDVGLIAKYYTVFNAVDITGIPKLPQYENKEVVSDKLIQKISEGMGVKILNDGGDRAYYSVKQDSIHLPTKESFFSSYDYNSTALHELSHASGAPHRLSRMIGGAFGSQKYAYEELVAEISSSFMGEYLDIQATDQHIENHKAYVQGWIRDIKKDPDVLIHAIRDAGEAANYLEYKGGLINEEEYRKLGRNEKPLFQEGPAGPADIKKEFLSKGYQITPKLLKNIQKLNRITNKTHSLQSIHQAYKSGIYQDNKEIQKVLRVIVKDLQGQELLRQATVPTM